jgi:hypothetical protein
MDKTIVFETLGGGLNRKIFDNHHIACTFSMADHCCTADKFYQYYLNENNF